MKNHEQDIFIKGARMHNLKNIDVRIPYNQLTVVTGVSGSGKSSLTMDTLFAEGQRRYVESLSSYARQFMKNMVKPDVDSIEGLCPSIAIEQKVATGSTRSTVGSMTEISDYLRLLFARVGRTFSPISGREVKRDDVSDVIAFIKEQKEGKKIHILIPPSDLAKQNLQYYLSELMQMGFTRLYHSKTKNYSQIEELIEEHKQSLDKEEYILVDRLIAKIWKDDDEDLHRFADSVQLAMDETQGDVFIDVEGKIFPFNNRFELDGIKFEIPTPHLFSSNNPYGACPECEGFGQVIGIDHNLVIPNPKLSVYEGAVAPWHGEKMSQYQKEFIKNAGKINFPIHRAIENLSKEEYTLLWESKGGINDFFEMVSANLYKIQYRIMQARYRGRTTCPLCEGYKLRPEVFNIKISDTHIGQVFYMSISALKNWLDNIKLNKTENKIAERLLKELHIRVDILLKIGLGYLSLDRSANSLSGGESQRIQLTRIIGSNLSDSLYILDEPSIGLHPRDTDNLINVLKQLKKLGNTVVVVEHEELIMRNADYIIDVGPLASHLGGEIVANGIYKDLIKDKKSLTAQYLNGEKKVIRSINKKTVDYKIQLKQCRHHNLKNIDVEIPLQRFVVVSGVSGSGKTSLIKNILYPALKNQLNQFEVKPGKFEAVQGDVHKVGAVELVDQNPIGRSSRSNPVSYIKAYDDIRNLFTMQKMAKLRGYKAGHFSFNVDGGRCDTCKGDGEITVEMQFLADVKLPCEICQGRRFKDEVLEIKYNGKNISDILNMSVEEAIDFFLKEKKIHQKLAALGQVGLGYIKLGQSSDTLSGGEAQRVKLASFLLLSEKSDATFFIFDEPTTGLHFHDIEKLLKSFDALIAQGHTVLVIEHNMDIIKNADYIIDLGPEGGVEGGYLLYSGALEGLKKVKNSYTAQYL